MELIERFRYLMKINQLTSSAFADEIGVQRSSVSHILSGRNKPSLEFIQKTIKRFPKVDASWLVSGTTSSQSVIPEEKRDSHQIEKELPIESILPKESPTVEKELVKASIGSKDSNRKIEKVLIFYSDGTFEEFPSLNR